MSLGVRHSSTELAKHRGDCHYAADQKTVFFFFNHTDAQQLPRLMHNKGINVTRAAGILADSQGNCLMQPQAMAVLWDSLRHMDEFKVCLTIQRQRRYVG